jgi:hypothetical protein
MPHPDQRGREQYLSGKNNPPQPGDESVGQWSLEQLPRMNARFVERLERAIRWNTGSAGQSSAAAINGSAFLRLPQATRGRSSLVVNRLSTIP